MDNGDLLPFRTGQLAEALSFQIGYRGAWFRSKINAIARRGGYLSHEMEYIDFPGEKLTWMRIYQRNPNNSKKPQERQLMVRPPYPAIYHASQKPDISTISEVVVVVNDDWKVGDLVDWWTDGCYWSGKLTKLLGNDKAKIELLPPPMGEGKEYDVFFKDLRPTLEWSPEDGWTVPVTPDDNNRRCAELIWPLNQAVGAMPTFGHTQTTAGATHDQEAKLHVNASPSHRSFASSSTASDKSVSLEAQEVKKRCRSSHCFKEMEDSPDSDVESIIKNGNIGTGGCANSFFLIKDSSPLTDDQSAASLSYFSCQPKTSGSSSEGVLLNSVCSDSLEAAIVDLEILANKINWLKGILNSGFSSPASMRSSWKFVDNQASSGKRLPSSH